MKKNKCPNCGAPVTSEICQYCNSVTNVDTRYANAEYPVIECKEANLNFWNIVFPLIFGFSFGFFWFFPLFGLIAVGAFAIALVPVYRYVLISLFGKEVEATVYGYVNDNMSFNENPSQIVKLLVPTNDGLKFIMYQLIDINRPFKVNSKIKLKVYKDMFHIMKDKTYYFE